MADKISLPLLISVSVSWALSIFLLSRLWRGRNPLFLKLLLSVVIVIPFFGPLFFLWIEAFPSSQRIDVQDHSEKATAPARGGEPAATAPGVRYKAEAVARANRPVNLLITIDPVCRSSVKNPVANTGTWINVVAAPSTRDRWDTVTERLEESTSSEVPNRAGTWSIDGSVISGSAAMGAWIVPMVAIIERGLITIVVLCALAGCKIAQLDNVHLVGIAIVSEGEKLPPEAQQWRPTGGRLLKITLATGAEVRGLAQKYELNVRADTYQCGNRDRLLAKLPQVFDEQGAIRVHAPETTRSADDRVWIYVVEKWAMRRDIETGKATIPAYDLVSMAYHFEYMPAEQAMQLAWRFVDAFGRQASFFSTTVPPADPRDVISSWHFVASSHTFEALLCCRGEQASALLLATDED